MKVHSEELQKASDEILDKIISDLKMHTGSLLMRLKLADKEIAAQSKEIKYYESVVKDLRDD